MVFYYIQKKQKMKQILFTTLLIIASFFINFSTSLAQIEEDTTKITFIAYWEKGEFHDYEITKVKKKWKNEEIESIDSVSYIARFEVIDSTETSYKIKWTYKNDLFEMYNLSEKSIQKLSKYKNVEVIYKTDELGTFVGIENWKELSTMTKKVFEELFKSKQDAESKKLQQKLQPIMMAYDTKEGIEQVLFKELHVFHLPLGGQFDVTEPLLYEEELPNLLSGGVVRGNGKLTFENINREEGFCTYYQELKLNQEDAKNMILGVFKRMKLPENDFENEFKKSYVSIDDSGKYIYFYGYGLPLDLVSSREVHVKLQGENVRQIETIMIKLVLD